jgi:hypothetical protein
MSTKNKTKKRIWIISFISLLLLICLAVTYLILFNDNFTQNLDINSNCNQDSDCEIRANNYHKLKACNKNDINCFIWSILKQTGSPGHTDYPKLEEVIPFCSNNQCSIKYDCSKCSSLKTELEEYCQNNPFTSEWMCDMYKECNC